MTDLIGYHRQTLTDGCDQYINEKALRDTLQKLNRGLERYKEGKLGICLKCGGEIPFGRLKFMPYTTRCVKCA
ncbi:MAG: TraR/DksA C4-type zinc finger protein [Balneolaceae bacterium]|nr:TraR/DksA C4-type zinc finger protein [Balneolaceae bacterium]